ncbi:LCP family protein [Amycolatopsis alkalitolerans]|uniref:LytR family transcriptional regulator n=1 Tax=Amycolatopsis alkalitolerans TaxID=2547244 RepID=A0A5C4LUN5_9PSEU|nr:LCP family protein [Amycolatopsis alkalitolerans]TNC21882.1 LytR family transcriptional regulator [Amycolatopsis alkalitolerans]
MAEPDEETAGRHPNRVRLAIKLTIVVLAVLLATAVTAIYLASERLGDQIRRYPGVFSGLDDSARPAPTAAMNLLLVGSDSLATQPTTGTEATRPGFVPGAQRSDVIMLVHIDAGYHKATVVSLPRDSWVNVPGHGMAKINASYSIGGPTLLVRTVEGLTGLRVDHFAVIDFAGFEALTDAVGGIDVTIDRTTTFGTLVLHAGPNHLDGTQALGYVRQREGLPGGDLDRVERHQNALRALLRKAVANGSFSDPVRAYRFLDVLTRWITVDETMTNGELRSLGWQLRGLRPGAVTFLTAPVSGLGREGTQSVVYLDPGRDAQLWRYAGADDVEGYLRAHPGSALGNSTP